MPTSEQNITTRETGSWLQSKVGAAAVVLLAGVVRLWAASGTFLNPDEALHVRLANQLSLAEAYRASLTASHPPLLTFILYFWRALGTSELWLRMPSVLAGVAFCWMFYKWLVNTAGDLAGLVGLLLVAFLPPIVELGAEIRQYSLLLAFLACATFFLDEAFAKNSTGRMWAFSFSLYLAMLSHYSAFLLAAALGFYAILRILRERPPLKLIAAWAIGQAGGLALATLLYKTHISKLGVGESRTALEGWMSEFFLRRSYFDPARDHYLSFLVGHTFGVFQYFFGQLAVGDVMGIFFVAGIVLLLRKRSSEGSRSPKGLAVLLLLAFTAACLASVAHVYPYGGTRHVAFLIIPAVAGVSFAIAASAREKWAWGIGISLLIVTACAAFGKPRPPYMNRSDQNRARMAAALTFIQQNVSHSDLIFTDYQTDVILGHYLCQQRPISFEPAPAGFEQFSCGGTHIVSLDYRGWQFWADNFPQEWQRFLQSYKPTPETNVWVVQAGWGIGLPEDLRAHNAQFHNLQFDSFGNNIKIFKLTVGHLVPLSSARPE